MPVVEESVRAKAAHKAVLNRAADTDPGAWRDYRSIALKLPVMVHREGLVVALHFVAARSNAGQRAILDDLAKDLGKEDRQGLLAWLRGLGPQALRDETREVQRRLAWYKRMVQAFGKSGEDPSGDGRHTDGGSV